MNRPPHPETLLLRLEAEALHRTGDHAAALDYYRQILNIDPLADDIWLHAAEIMNQKAEFSTSLEFLRKAVHINPQNALGWYNLAFLLQAVEDWEAVEDAAQKALQLDPTMDRAWFVLGNAQRGRARHLEAINSYKSSLRLRESNADAWNNLGLVLYEIGDYDSAAGAYLNALKHDVRLFSAHSNLSVLLYKVGKLEGARRAAERALELNPNNHEALNIIGCLESLRGQHEVAIEYFNKALESNPEFYKAQSNMLFCVLHKDGTTLEEVWRLHQEWYAMQGARHTRENVTFKNSKNPNRRLRVGFVSGDFRSHPVGYFIFNTFSRLIEQKPFDIYVYANQYETDDAFTLRFRNMTGENWRVVWQERKEKLLEQIAADEIDVLFDLTGQNDRHRLDIFCARAAPVQVTWAGYMATTGLPQMDWLLGDSIQTPAADQPYYTERLYQMPHSFICYTPPPDAPPVAGVPPCIQNGFITFVSFNKPAKITPRAIRLWSEVMRELPGSRLLLKFSGFNDPQTVGFFIQQFAENGIDANRLTFEGISPHHELLARYNEADIALDSLPYTGSTTTLEALWMGTPLVTLPGVIFPARHAASYLSALGASELIASDEKDYVQKIIALARDPVRLSQYKQNLREQMRASPLCDQSAFVPAFIAAIRHFWQDYCSRAEIM